jgi:hypothetical protein
MRTDPTLGKPAVDVELGQLSALSSRNPFRLSQHGNPTSSTSVLVTSTLHRRHHAHVTARLLLVSIPSSILRGVSRMG